MPEPLQPGQAPGDPRTRGGDRDPAADGQPGAGAPEREHAPSAGEAAGGARPQPAESLQRLDRRWVTAERLSGAMGAGVLSMGALVAVLVFGSGWRLFGLGAWLALASALFVAAMMGPALQYRRAGYRVTPFGIEIRWGILWRRVTIVPRSRIQHTDVEQGPLLRKFGLAKLVIHTAGTEHSTVPLYGLSMPDATAIRDDLMGRTEGGQQPPAAAGNSPTGGSSDGI